MKVRTIVFLLGILSLTISISGYSQEIENANICSDESIWDYVEEEVYYKGIVHYVDQPYEKGFPTYLYSGKSYPENTTTLVIWGNDHKEFFEYFKKLEGMDVTIKGKVYIQDGLPVIRIYKTDDINSYVIIDEKVFKSKD
jgi:hypothetical protein